MLFYLCSSDPDQYSIIKFSASPSLGNNPLLFRINQLSTIASFKITTVNDYITFRVSQSSSSQSEISQNGVDDVEIKINFEDKCEYERDELASTLSAIFTDVAITVTFNDGGTLTLSHSSNSFDIIDASHRVKLLLGLYHTALPVESIGNQIKIKSTPYHCYGNQLFLRSKISSVVGFKDSDQGETYISLCYHVFEIFINGIPIISKTPGTLTKIKPSDLSNLEFTLVDFQNEEIILNSPLMLVMELISENVSHAQMISS